MDTIKQCIEKLKDIPILNDCELQIHYNVIDYIEAYLTFLNKEIVFYRQSLNKIAWKIGEVGCDNLEDARIEARRSLTLSHMGDRMKECGIPEKGKKLLLQSPKAGL